LKVAPRRSRIQLKKFSGNAQMLNNRVLDRTP
jgi:hypothetical protein